jgi:hypothetical protein
MQTLTLPGYMGRPYEVTGDVLAGLMLHKVHKSWMITHAASGCTIGPGDKLQRDAKARRDRLLALASDWTPESIEGIAKANGMETRALVDAVRARAY